MLMIIISITLLIMNLRFISADVINCGPIYPGSEIIGCSIDSIPTSVNDILSDFSDLEILQPASVRLTYSCGIGIDYFTRKTLMTCLEELMDWCQQETCDIKLAQLVKTAGGDIYLLQFGDAISSEINCDNSGCHCNGPINTLINPSYNGCGNDKWQNLCLNSLFPFFYEACKFHDLCWDDCQSTQEYCDSVFIQKLIDKCKKVILIPALNVGCITVAWLFYDTVHFNKDYYIKNKKLHCNCLSTNSVRKQLEDYINAPQTAPTIINSSTILYFNEVINFNYPGDQSMFHNSSFCNGNITLCGTTSYLSISESMKVNFYIFALIVILTLNIFMINFN